MVFIPAKMGRINMRSLVDRLQSLGIASRADLAKSLGMSQPTAGKIVDALIGLGVIDEVDLEAKPQGHAWNADNGPARMGRPARMLVLNRLMPRFIGVELGVSKTGLAPLPFGLDQPDSWAQCINTPDNAPEWLARLKDCPVDILPEDLWGVLVSVPGIVDEQAGRVLFSPNLHWTEKIDLKERLQEIWNVPVALVQEERALALGHQFAGANGEDFLLVDVGDGVGGAVIVSGRLYATPLSISGELGHTPVLGNARRCGCGATGCVETLLSIRGLLQSHAQAHGVRDAGWETLQAHIRDNGVEPWLAQTLDTAAAIVAGALNVLGLRCVVLTGKLNELPPSVMEYFSGRIVQGTMWARFGQIKVESAPRRRMAGLVAVGIERFVLPKAAREKKREAEPQRARWYSA